MKLIAATLAAMTLACAAVAVAQPQFRVRGPVAATVQPPSPWQKSKNTERDAPTPEFSAAEPIPMDCNLTADAYEQRQPPVTGVVAPRDCAPPGDRVKDTPRVIGPSFGAPGFSGVIESVGEKYTMFSIDGQPVRATADPALIVAKQKQQEPDADDEDDAD